DASTWRFTSWWECACIVQQAARPRKAVEAAPCTRREPVIGAEAVAPFRARRRFDTFRAHERSARVAAARGARRPGTGLRPEPTPEWTRPARGDRLIALRPRQHRPRPPWR